MAVLIVVVFALSALMFVLFFADQRKVYSKTGAWWFHNPDAHEPADRTLEFQHVRILLGAVMALIFGFVLVVAQRHLAHARAETLRSVTQAAASLEGDRVHAGSMEAHVRSAIAITQPTGSPLQVTETDGYRYEITEITGRAGRLAAVCLTVEPTQTSPLGKGDLSVSTKVTAGTC